MIVKLSDYILEQEVSTASCDDIVLEQLQAEIEVAHALTSAYAKQALMMEYSVYQEETTSTTETTDKKWYQKAWEAIKKFFRAIGTWFLNRWNDIKKFFRKDKSNPFDVDQMVENLSNLPEEEKKGFKIRSKRWADAADSLNVLANAFETELMPIIDEILELGTQGGQMERDAYKKRIAELQDKLNDYSKRMKERRAYFENDQRTEAVYLDYDETMKMLKDAQAKMKGLSKERIDRITEATKRFTQKINKISMPDIDANVAQQDAETVKKYNDNMTVFSKLAEAAQNIMSKTQKAFDQAVDEIDEGMRSLNKAYTDKARKEKLAKNLGNASSIDRSRLGDAYKDVSDADLLAAQAKGYDIYS